MPVSTEPGPLTARQREIFLFIWDHTCREGFQPSYRDVMEHFGITSPNGVLVHIRAMARKGWVRPGTMRSVRFLRQPDGREFRGFVAAPEKIADHADAGSRSGE